MNNKGFMMAEVIVVSAIILVFLTGLYLSYNNLFSIYNTRINYYDSSTLYKLAYYRDILIREDKMNNTLNSAKVSVVNVFNNGDDSINKLSDSDSVFMLYISQERITTIFSPLISSVNSTFVDYIQYLYRSSNFESNYVMVMENCIDRDNCKYAYLEVYDGYET